VQFFNLLNAELNPICHLLALLGAHPIFHVSRITVKAVIFPPMMSIKKTDCPILQKGVKRTWKTVTL
jgi:hypothetical protein